MDVYFTNAHQQAKKTRKAATETRNESKNVRQKSVLLRYVAESTIENSSRLKAGEHRKNRAVSQRSRNAPHK
jgi:hypothetical protein